MMGCILIKPGISWWGKQLVVCSYINIYLCNKTEKILKKKVLKGKESLSSSLLFCCTLPYALFLWKALPWGPDDCLYCRNLLATIKKLTSDPCVFHLCVYCKGLPNKCVQETDIICTKWFINILSMLNTHDSAVPEIWASQVEICTLAFKMALSHKVFEPDHLMWPVSATQRQQVSNQYLFARSASWYMKRHT